MHKGKAHAPKKGVAGKKTGGAARKAIKARKAAGSTTAQIARAANRKPSTISNIESGNIKNPPKNLAASVRKAKTTKKKK